MPAHPYIPNSEPRVKAEMLAAVGASSIEELYGAIPDRLLLGRPLAIPGPVGSEVELVRRMEGLLGQNRSTRELLSFLGGGCWNHHVPAVVDEIIDRAEFVSAYYGTTYADHGKLQAAFEFASMLGELVDRDVVSQATYDWGTAAATAICLSARVTGRSRALVPASIGAERRSIIAGYCRPWVELVEIGFDPATGLLDQAALADALGDDVACVYLESPGYLGTIETGAPAICAAAHAAGALVAVGVDPLSLGVLAPPPSYGADIVCGDIQSLGIHQHWGGGVAGFIAVADEERLVSELPTWLTGAGPTGVPGEIGFGEVAFERMAYVQRGDSREFTGTTHFLWAIAAAVNLSLLGPQGIAELGRTCMARVRYLAHQLDAIPGVRAPALAAPVFKEVVVDVSGTGRTVAELNAALLERGILGGHDLSAEYPALGQCALYCATEMHAREDIDRLAAAIREVVA